mgnify:CR=1 FL=1
MFENERKENFYNVSTEEESATEVFENDENTNIRKLIRYIEK